MGQYSKEILFYAYLTKIILPMKENMTKNDICNISCNYGKTKCTLKIPLGMATLNGETLKSGMADHIGSWDNIRAKMQQNVFKNRN